MELNQFFSHQLKFCFVKHLLLKSDRKLLFSGNEMKCQAHNELFISAYFKKFYIIGSCRKDLCIGGNPLFSYCSQGVKFLFFPIFSYFSQHTPIFPIF